MTCYRVVNWATHYETNKTRELKKLPWMKSYADLSDHGYIALMDAAGGSFAIYGAWIAIRCVAAQCNPRGTLIRKDGTAHTAKSIAMTSRGKEREIKKALDILTSEAVAWLEHVSIDEALAQKSGTFPAPIRHFSGTNPALFRHQSGGEVPDDCRALAQELDLDQETDKEIPTAVTKPPELPKDSEPLVTDGDKIFQFMKAEENLLKREGDPAAAHRAWHTAEAPAPYGNTAAAPPAPVPTAGALHASIAQQIREELILDRLLRAADWSDRERAELLKAVRGRFELDDISGARLLSAAKHCKSPAGRNVVMAPVGYVLHAMKHDNTPDQAIRNAVADIRKEMDK